MVFSATLLCCVETDLRVLKKHTIQVLHYCHLVFFKLFYQDATFSLSSDPIIIITNGLKDSKKELMNRVFSTKHILTELNNDLKILNCSTTLPVDFNT